MDFFAQGRQVMRERTREEKGGRKRYQKKGGRIENENEIERVEDGR